MYMILYIYNYILYIYIYIERERERERDPWFYEFVMGRCACKVFRVVYKSCMKSGTLGLARSCPCKQEAAPSRIRAALAARIREYWSFN